MAGGQGYSEAHLRDEEAEAQDGDSHVLATRTGAETGVEGEPRRDQMLRHTGVAETFTCPVVLF